MKAMWRTVPRTNGDVSGWSSLIVDAMSIPSRARLKRRRDGVIGFDVDEENSLGTLDRKK